MKLLVIAGPYEADRIRRAAVSAGFEAVAVEPGESLSGWIAGSRPDLIVMAPQIVNPDPSVAVAKVKAASRGRVPIFLVGDAGDEVRMRPLADGYFVRPVAVAALAAQAKGAVRAAGGAPPKAKPTLKSPMRAASGAGSKPTLGSPNLAPLMAQPGRRVPGGTLPRPRERGVDPLSDLSQSIDALLDAEMRDVIRTVGPVRRAGTPVGPPWSVPGMTRPAPDPLERTRLVPPDVEPPRAARHADGDDDSSRDEAVKELRDESSQKTVEVPREVVAAMIGGHDAGGYAEDGTRRPAVRRKLAPNERGSLADSDVAALFGRIAAEELTGWLTFRRGGVEKAIVFEGGAPVLAGSNQPEDRMGEMLVRQGRLSAEQQSRSTQILLATGRRLGVVLVEMGLIRPSELGPLVRRHYEEIIYSLFAWELGDWTLEPDRPEKEETVLLEQPAAAVLLEGIRRKYSAPRLLARLGGAGRVFRLPGGRGTSERLEQMALTDDERIVVPLFDGVRSLAEIRSLVSVADQTLWALAWSLSVLRQLETVQPAGIDDELSSLETAGNGSTVAGVGVVAADAALAADASLDRARVLARYSLVQEGDYFQVLGVGRDASPQEIRRAHQTLTRELGAGALAAAVVGELGKELSAIRVVLDEALRVLDDGELRMRYQRHAPPPPSVPGDGPASLATD